MIAFLDIAVPVSHISPVNDGGSFFFARRGNPRLAGTVYREKN